MRRADVVVVGAGIVGLATALRLLERDPRLRVVVLDKEGRLAAHQTGHNSGVLHAGLYYAPGSLKARLCTEGKAALEAFCARRGIPFRTIGKLVVAVDESELGRLDALRARALENGVPGLESWSREELREREPHVVGLRALWSPTTGIVDFGRVAREYAAVIAEGGAEIHTGTRVVGLRERARDVIVSTEGETFVASGVVACAGVYADRLGALTGRPRTARIVPFRGDYYTLTPDARGLVRSLVYPVPDPGFPFLGVHFTPRMDGETLAGPNAVLAFSREGYRFGDFDPDDLADVVTFSGFWRLAARHWRTGMAEMWRDVSKRAYLAELRRYVPELRSDQLVFGPSGVRAQLLGPDGKLVDDFALGGTPRVLSVENAPSPAATSSLAIGRVLADEARRRFLDA